MPDITVPLLGKYLTVTFSTTEKSVGTTKHEIFSNTNDDPCTWMIFVIHVRPFTS